MRILRSSEGVLSLDVGRGVLFGCIALDFALVLEDSAVHFALEFLLLALAQAEFEYKHQKRCSRSRWGMSNRNETFHSISIMKISEAPCLR